MRDIDIAKSKLLSGGYTCVLRKGEAEYCSEQRGVKPLLDFLDSGKSFAGFSAADRIVGAGAAHLYVLLGVKAVWAEFISESAADILQSGGIEVAFEKKVPAIKNRSGDGYCPIEQAVKGMANAQEALEAIKNKIREMKK